MIESESERERERLPSREAPETRPGCERGREREREQLLRPSNDNKSKNYPIVLKFGTDVAFIYQVRCPKKSVHYEKRYLRLKIKNKIFESRFLGEYLIYRLEILTSYCTNWRLYVVNISRDYLHLFFRKK